MLRIYNGIEYASSESKDLCDRVGIEPQLTVPYTPEQNIVSERRNQSVLEMVRCMLNKKEIPKEFLVDACNTIVFLQNRLPAKPLQVSTPFQVWYECKH